MALVLRSDAGPGKGRQVLKEAIDGFRASLTDEERQRFEDQRAADPAKPEEDSILGLIVEIDSKNSQKLSRYVAPKLRAFLEAVQQFTGIVDAFITFAPEPIAQLVWASVKITFSLLSSFGEYFDKLCTLFSQIGESCPRLREFGSLYESSASLQNVLCLYFAEVVVICGKALKVSKQPGIVMFFKATFKPFEKDFGDSQSNLDKYSSQIKEELSLAFSKVQVQEEKLDKLERGKNEVFRNQVALFSSTARKELADIRQWQIQAERRRVETMRRQIKDNLCSIDPGLAWKQARRQCLAQTAEWFRDNANFATWLTQDTSVVLAYLANLGSGKTVVTSNVIAHLSFLNPTSSNIAYFLCQSEMAASQRSRNVLGGLARQLLEASINSMESTDLEDLLRKSSSPSDEDMLSLITTHQATDSTSFIVIDGLDECEVSSMEIVLRGMETLLKSTPKGHTLKVFLSSRPDYAQKIESCLKPLLRLSPTPSQLEHDLDAYIEATLALKLEQGQLNLNQPELIVVIQNALLSGAQGMFLWAYLLIEDLCLRNSDNEILFALQHIPSKLSELFDRLLMKVVDNEVSGEVSRNLLAWTLGARRTLSIDEIREAVTLEPGQSELNTAALPNDIFRSINCCHGLLCIDEDDLRVRLVHPSLKQHIFSENNQRGPKMWRLNATELEKQLAVHCMTYLGFSEFTQSLVKVNTPPPVVTPSELAREVAGIRKHKFSSADKAIALLRGSSGRPAPADTAKILLDVRRNLEDIARRNRRTNSTYGRSKLIEYVSSNWIHHCSSLEKADDDPAWKSFSTLLQSSDTHFEKPWMDTNISKNFTSQLQYFIPPEHPTQVTSSLAWAVENENLALLEYEFSESVITPSRMDLRRKIPPTGKNVLGEWKLVLQDLRRLLPSSKSSFAALAGNRLNALTANITFDSGLAFLHDLLVVLYDAKPRKIKADTFRANQYTSQKGWSLEWLEECGYELPHPPNQPSVSELAAAHKMGRPSFLSHYVYRGSLPVAVAVVMNRAEYLKLLVDAYSFMAPWLLFPVVELAIAYQQPKMAQLLYEKGKQDAKRSADQFDLAIRGPYQHYLPGLLASALQHDMSELAVTISMDVKTPGMRADESGNLAMMYACEYRNVEVYARLLLANADVAKANDYGLSVTNFVQQSLDYLNAIAAAASPSATEPENVTAAQQPDSAGDKVEQTMTMTMTKEKATETVNRSDAAIAQPPDPTAEKVRQMMTMTKEKATEYVKQCDAERAEWLRRQNTDSSSAMTGCCCVLLLLILILLVVGIFAMLLTELWYVFLVIGVVSFIFLKLAAVGGGGA